MKVFIVLALAAGKFWIIILLWEQSHYESLNNKK